MAFIIKKRGRLTYYYRGEAPSFSNLVTEVLSNGDRMIYFAGLTGGKSATRALSLEDTAFMDPAKEIPRVFAAWESWLKESGICGSLEEIDFVEMHVFGCQPKKVNPLVDPESYAFELGRLRQAYAQAYSSFFREHLPHNGVPARFTVHVVDVPDTAASYEFYATALWQRALQEEA